MSDTEIILAAASTFGAGLLALGRSAIRLWGLHRKESLEVTKQQAETAREQGERRIAAVVEQTRSNTLLIERIEASRSQVIAANAMLEQKIDLLGEKIDGETELRNRTVYRLPDRTER